MRAVRPFHVKRKSCASAVVAHDSSVLITSCRPHMSSKVNSFCSGTDEENQLAHFYEAMYIIPIAQALMRTCVIAHNQAPLTAGSCVRTCMAGRRASLSMRVWCRILST